MLTGFLVWRFLAGTLLYDDGLDSGAEVAPGNTGKIFSLGERAEVTREEPWKQLRMETSSHHPGEGVTVVEPKLWFGELRSGMSL